MADFFSNIILAAQALHWTEIWAVIFGLIYVILAVRENVWCWFWGILSCGLWAWATYDLYAYYVDAILNIFYVVMGFVGIYQWKFGRAGAKELKVTQLPVSQHVVVIASSVVLAILFGYLFEKYTPARATYLDSLTTALAVFATFMTIQKKLESWIYWIVIDLLYVYLYWDAGAYLFMFLFVLNTVIAVRGFLVWKIRIQDDGFKIQDFSKR